MSKEFTDRIEEIVLLRPSWSIIYDEPRFRELAKKVNVVLTF